MVNKRPEPADIAFGRRMRERRAVVMMSQERLGDIIGVTFQQIQRYEAGVNRVTLGKIIRMAAALDTTFEELTRGLGDARVVQRFSEARIPDAKEIKAGEYFSRIKNDKLRGMMFNLLRQLAEGNEQGEGANG